MANEEFTRTLAYANSAFALIKRGEIPPYPQFYELFYTYATGVNPSLNERINSILGDGVPKVELVESLYNEFLKSETIDERLNLVSNLITKNIGSVHSAISTAAMTTRNYSGTLQQAHSNLKGGISQGELNELTQQLLVKTNEMQEINAALELKLDSAGEDIATLKKDMEEVQRQSMTDSLTKLYNRNFFDQHLAMSITDAREKNGPLCLVMLDIDHFKTFNDTFGHQTGDQVLRLVGMTLNSNTKGSDMACRYGGEEFALLLPNTQLVDAVTLSETIRKVIQAKELLKRSTNEKLGRITSSFGVAELTTKDTDISILERADRALYVAKRNGRNRVIAENDKLMHASQAA